MLTLHQYLTEWVAGAVAGSDGRMTEAEAWAYVVQVACQGYTDASVAPPEDPS